jgi:hypothetical protein
MICYLRNLSRLTLVHFLILCTFPLFSTAEHTDIPLLPSNPSLLICIISNQLFNFVLTYSSYFVPTSLKSSPQQIHLTSLTGLSLDYQHCA